MLDFFWRPLAFSVIGVDTADREEIRQTIDLTFHLDPEEGMINDVSLTAQIKLREYYSQQIESRRRAPRDDMMTALTEAETAADDGPRRLTTSEAADFTSLLVGAGTETVARLLAVRLHTSTVRGYETLPITV